MDIILRKNTVDEDMIDLIGATPNGKEMLWGVVHCDFLYGEGGALEEIFKANGEVSVEIEAKL